MSEPQLVLTRPDGSQVPPNEAGMSEAEQQTIRNMIIWVGTWSRCCPLVRFYCYCFSSSFVGIFLVALFFPEGGDPPGEETLVNVLWVEIPQLMTYPSCWMIAVSMGYWVPLWIDKAGREHKFTGQILRDGLVSLERTAILAIPTMAVAYLYTIHYAELPIGVKLLALVHVCFCVHHGVKVNASCYRARKILEPINEAMRQICTRNRALAQGVPCTCFRCKPMLAAGAA